MPDNKSPIEPPVPKSEKEIAALELEQAAKELSATLSSREFKIFDIATSFTGLGILCIIGAVFVDTTKPLKPVFGYQITDISSQDIQFTLGMLGLILFSAAILKHRQSKEAEELERLRAAEHLFTYKGFTIVFRLLDPKRKTSDPDPAIANAERGLSKIIDQNPAAELIQYESVLNIKIVSISKAQPHDPPPPDDIQPIGTPYY
jgi:hypothetical protein